MLLVKAFSDKNYLDMYLKGANLPNSIVRNIKGTLLDNEYNIITQEQAIDLISQEKEVIVKPSMDSGGGRSILFIKGKDKNEIRKIIKENNDYVVQKILKQHDEFNKFNDTCINTIRVLSFLYKNEIHILYSVLRVGRKGSRVDNASMGGYQIVIDKNGKFTDYIVDINNHAIDKNNIKYDFENKYCPFYDKIMNEVKRLHPRLSQFKLIGWDITVDEFEKPTVLEVNLKDIGMSDKSQLVNGPLFGELTNEVLTEVFKKNN